jgi:valyl-tRNA synthetase
VVEPYLTDQWYVKIAPLAQPAIDAVEDGRIEFVPANWSKTYFDWMHRIEDWCISRQLWWGHRIPAWYDQEGNIHVGTSEQDARSKSGLPDDVELWQDEDVLDTWFSSALWPFTTLGWPEKTDYLQRFYPTSVMVTGFDIIFFWVARMIMMGLKFMDDVPFRTVYIHGLIRDAQGQKMSKSKGNVLDPIDLIDGIDLEQLITKRTSGLMQPQMAPGIEKATKKEFPDGIPPFGTDALRFTFAALATTGRDIRFDLGRIEGYRNFCNKLWNAARFVLMQTEGKTVMPATRHSIIDRWIISRANRMITEVENQFTHYRLDLAAQALYEFIWNEYCDWYLEFAKTTVQSTNEEEQVTTRNTLLTVLETCLRTLHPIMPFITEEIWQRVKTPLEIEGESIMLQSFPSAGPFDEVAEQDVEWIKNVIQGIRRIRSELNLPPSKMLDVLYQAGHAADHSRQQRFSHILSQLARIQSANWVDQKADTAQCAVALVGDLKILIPLKGLVDVEAELTRLMKQLERENADLLKSQNKLGNRSFVDNAPEAVVDQERERLISNQANVDNLHEQIRQLESLRD